MKWGIVKFGELLESKQIRSSGGVMGPIKEPDEDGLYTNNLLEVLQELRIITRAQLRDGKGDPIAFFVNVLSSPESTNNLVVNQAADGVLTYCDSDLSTLTRADKVMLQEDLKTVHSDFLRRAEFAIKGAKRSDEPSAMDLYAERMAGFFKVLDNKIGMGLNDSRNYIDGLKHACKYRDLNNEIATGHTSVADKLAELARDLRIPITSSRSRGTSEEG